MLAGMRKLFLDKKVMDCSAILEEEGEEITIQTVGEGVVFKNWTAAPIHIWMNEEGAEKTAFIIPWGIYCYKNDAIWFEEFWGHPYKGHSTLFHYMIPKEIKVYVDDVIIESKKGSDHIANLRKFFDRHRKYNLKLNPVKCAFGVPARKLLGFIISRWESHANIIYVTQKVVKGKPLPDHLAENPVGREYEPSKTYCLNEEVSFVGEDIAEAYNGWRMFFNVAENFKGVGIRAVFVSEIDQHYPISSKLRFPCTNNMAEYEACILGLRLAIDMNVLELLVIRYSDLLVHQVVGEWATKNTKILPYLHYVQELIKRFTKIEFKHFPRIHNELEDALATLSSMIQYLDKNFIDPIPIEIRKHPAYCAHVEEESDRRPWFHDIKEYLEKIEYPENAAHTQTRTLQRLDNISFRVEEFCIEGPPIWDCCDVSMPRRHLDCSKKYIPEHAELT
ncbi:uncharacterized protein [Nicotiana tomentosiformis]|uniref:uncharacterized protein n=1 Tax=Nicotiana tomentosiformis TaxID=4098 RepID=UPI00388C5504